MRKKIGSILRNPDICLRDGCKNMLTGKQRFCSDKCRKAASRTGNPDKPKSDTEVGQDVLVNSGPHEYNHPSLIIPELDPNFSPITYIHPDQAGSLKEDWVEPASLEDYNDNNDRKYITRANPDKLNWGPWMTTEELVAAGFRANRVSIPGDWDYVGVAV